MQEELQQKTVAITVKAAKLSGKVLAKAIAAVLRQMKKGRDAPKIGNQSIRRLNRTVGGNTDNIEVTGRIRSFERFARKFQVSYHIEKNVGTNPPKWTVYFKAKQAADLTGAFSEYAKKTLKRDNRPSLLAQLNKFKEVSKNTVIDRVKNKDRGAHEL